MSAEQTINQNAGATSDQTEATISAPPKYERSTIEFPYNDLDDAVEIARAIHANAGVSCTLDQLAAYLGQSMSSGAFRLRTSNARIFGFTENERGKIRLTQLGQEIVDPAQESAARVDAFLQVQLYRRIFDSYRGYTLPPSTALEKFMLEAGVSSKQTGKARQAFMRSAKQAGFFAHGEDRLVRPAIASIGPGTKPLENQESDAHSALGGGGGIRNLDPVIRGLIDKLPGPGAVWAESQRKLWLDLLEGCFKLVYKNEDGDNRQLGSDQ